MRYILYPIIFIILLAIFLVCIAVALAVGAVAGVFVAYIRAAITYISSVTRGVDNRGARIFMTTISAIAVALFALLILAAITAGVMYLLNIGGII